MKVRCSLTNSMRTPRPVKLLHQAAQVVEIARQAIHAVHDHRVALAHEAEQILQLRAAHILAGGLVGEHPVHRHALELALRVLIEAADADIADALSVQGVLPSKVSGKTL